MVAERSRIELFKNVRRAQEAAAGRMSRLKTGIARACRRDRLTTKLVSTEPEVIELEKIFLRESVAVCAL